MAKYKKKKVKRGSSPLLVDAIQSFGLLFVLLGAFILKLVFSLFSYIGYLKSGYKQKSGNGFLKTYFNKGNYGEYVIYRKSIKIFGKNNVFTNIYLDNKNTEKTEIDVIAISSSGIFIFEVKNYAGYVFGSEEDTHWTQTLNRFSKHKFYNPLKQNYAHTEALKSYLKIADHQVVPVVVFSNQSKFKKLTIDKKSNIIQFKQFDSFTKKYLKQNQSNLSSDQIEQFQVKLIEKSSVTQAVKDQHIEDIKKMT